MPGFSGPPGAQGADGELVIIHFYVELAQASSRFRLCHPLRTCIPLKFLLHSQTYGHSNSYSHCGDVCNVGNGAKGEVGGGRARARGDGDKAKGRESR